MLLLTDKNQAHVVEASSSSSRYLADLLNIYNLYFEQIVRNHICLADLLGPELQCIIKVKEDLS